MPIPAAERTAYLRRLKQNRDAQCGSMKVAYKSTHAEAMPVYKIDLNHLVYNQHNGRIGTLVQAYEAQYGELDVESEEDTKTIEKFLEESHREKNARTYKSLAEMGQRDPGIVTLDGVIIDGNRRAYLLNKLHRNEQRPNIFEAVILPDEFADNVKEIKRLETLYQIGLDEKAGYNALEKYLQIQDLQSHGFTKEEIAAQMNEDVPTIDKWIEVKNLMNEYLACLGYEKMYTRIGTSEDWFWKLQESMKRLDPNGGGGPSRQPEWNYQEADRQDLKRIMFDYIRTTREASSDLLGGGQAYRVICSAGKDGFFKYKQIWENFRDRHDGTYDKVQEKSIDEYRLQHPTVDLTTVLRTRDADLTDTVKNDVNRNFSLTTREVGTNNSKNRPKELLESVLQQLNAIEPDGEMYKALCESDEEILELLGEIGKAHWELKKAAEKGSRSND